MSMRLFDPTIHTPEGLAAQLETMSVQQETLIGSLGRAVLYHWYGSDPEREFRIRGEPVERSGAKARDIDLLGMPEVAGRYTEAPFEVDFCTHDEFVQVVMDRGDWILTSPRKTFCEPVRPEVMEPIRGETVLGVSAQTLPPQTQLALYGLKGLLRPKDRLTMVPLQELVSHLNPQDRLPGVMFQPFQALRRLNQQDPYIRLLRAYTAIVPDCVRVQVRPLEKVLKRLLLSAQISKN